MTFKGELRCENKLISNETAFRMLENDMYTTGISEAILELLSFKVGLGNHQRGISLLQKISDIFDFNHNLLNHELLQLHFQTSSTLITTC